MSLICLIPEPGAFYIMDRGHVDFERLFSLYRTGRFFVIRAKSTTKYRRRYSHPGDESGGVRCDRTIALSGVKSVRDYPLPLRHIRYHDVQTSKTFNFLTNNFAIPAQTVADLCRYRRQVELFLQVDQATPTHQAVLRDLRERGQKSDLGRYLGLHPRRYHQELP